MAELPVELVPVEGGYTVHLVGCDCEERLEEQPGARVRRRFPATSVADAVARMYREGPVGVTAPDRFLRRDCIRNLPMTDPTPVPWGTMHAVYVKQAALSIYGCASAAVARSRDSTVELAEGAMDENDDPVPTWVPATDDLARKLRHGFSARLWAVCLAGITGKPDTDEACSQIVTQAEKALRDAMERALEVETGHASDVARLYAEYERKASVEFMRAVRSCLAHVHAHRATRDAIAG